MREHRSQAPPHVQSTLAKLSLCRTPALGGHVYECSTCDHRVIVHNSCGDRHCPQCSGAKRRDWLSPSAKLLLPGVTYYQVVFTVPDKLSSLTLGNRQTMFDLLFRSAWRALKRTIQDEQQFEAAAAMVLHTWSQHLQPGSESAGVSPEAAGGTLSANPAELQTTASTNEETNEETWEHRCPKCESLSTASLLTQTHRTDRPGWRTVMSGLHRPTWYRQGWYDNG